MECVDNQIASDLFAQKLDAEMTGAIYRHTSRCAACQVTLATTAAPLPPGQYLDPQFVTKLEARLRAFRTLGHSFFTDQPMLESGVKVGTCIVIQRRGGGGQGAVYEAYDPANDRRVVLKLFHIRGNADAREKASRRIEEAALRLNRTAHPNLLHCYEAGRFGDQVYVITEFIKGVPLSQLVQQPWRRVLEHFVQAGRGLSAAHKAGISHLAFHPDACVVENAAERRVRVMDFQVVAAQADATSEGEAAGNESGGAIKAINPAMEKAMKAGDSFIGYLPSFVGQLPSEPQQPVFEAPPTALGQAEHVAPEQLRGAHHGHRTDQYNFCSALYHALFHQRPFRGASLNEWSRNVLCGSIERPPRESQVPKRVRNVILKGMSLRPEQRFGSMDELLAALTRSTRVNHLKHFVITAGVVACVASVATVSGLRVRHRDAGSVDCRPEATRLISEIWSSADQERVKSTWLASGGPRAAESWAALKRAMDGASAAWVDGYAQACQGNAAAVPAIIPCMEDHRRRLQNTLTTLEEDVEIGREFGPQLIDFLEPPEDCKKIATAGQAAFQGPLKEADLADLAGEQDRARERVAKLLPPEGENPALRSRLQLWLGQSYRRSGDYARARKHLREAAWVAQASGLDHESVRAGAELLRTSWDPQDVETWRGFTRAALQKSGSLPHLRALLSEAEAQGLYNLRETRQARLSAQENLVLIESAFGSSSPRAAQSLLQLGGYLREDGNVKLARSTLERSLELHEQLYGKNSLATAAVRVALAEVLIDDGDDAEFAKQEELTLAAVRAAPRGAALLEADLAALKGRFGARREKVDTAEEQLKRAAELYEQAGGPLYPGLAETLLDLADTLIANRHDAEATAILQQVEAMWAAQNMIGHPQYDRLRLGRARLHASRGQNDLVIATLAESADPDDTRAATPTLAEARLLLGRAYWASQQPNKAIDFFALSATTWERLRGEDALELIEPLSSLADAHLQRREMHLAVPPLEKLVKLLKPGLRRAQTMLSLARALRESGGDRDRAEALTREALNALAGDDRKSMERWLKDE